MQAIPFAHLYLLSAVLFGSVGISSDYAVIVLDDFQPCGILVKKLQDQMA